MKMITLFMSEADLARLDTLVAARESPNRSEFIRFILKSYLIDHERGFVTIPSEDAIMDLGAPEPRTADDTELEKDIVEEGVEATISAVDGIAPFGEDEEDFEEDEEEW